MKSVNRWSFWKILRLCAALVPAAGCVCSVCEKHKISWLSPHKDNVSADCHEETGKGYIFGTVTCFDKVTMLPSYVLFVRLYDIGRLSGVEELIAERQYQLDSGFPDTYALEYDKAKILPGGTYVMRAAVVLHGSELFRTDIDYKVLTYGSGNRADMVLITAK